MGTESQTKQILKHLKSGRKITPLEALQKYGSLRLGARVWDLRNLGYDVKSTMIKTNSGKHVKRYWL